MVVVHKGYSDTAFFAANANFFRYLFKLAVGLVMEQADAICQADGEVGVTDGAVAGAGVAGAVGVVVCATAVSEMARALALSAVNSLFMSCP